MLLNTAGRLQIEIECNANATRMQRLGLDWMLIARPTPVLDAGFSPPQYYHTATAANAAGWLTRGLVPELAG